MAAVIGAVVVTGVIVTVDTDPDLAGYHAEPTVLLPERETIGTRSSSASGPVVPIRAAEDLHGVWLQVGDERRPGLILAVDADGSFTLAENGRLLTEHASRGTWSLAGATLRFTGTGPLPCRADITGSWEARLEERGWLEMLRSGGAQGTGCQLDTGAHMRLARVSPRPVIGLQRPTSRPERTRPATHADLPGTWLQVEDQQARGTLIDFRIGGTFAQDHEGLLVSDPALRGSWASDDGVVTFLAATSRGCAAGRSWSWRTDLVERGWMIVEVVNDGGQEPCGAPLGTRWTLIRLSPVSSPSYDLIKAS